MLLLVMVKVILIVLLMTQRVIIHAVGIIRAVPFQLLSRDAVPCYVHFLHASEGRQRQCGLLAVVSERAVVGEQV